MKNYEHDCHDCKFLGTLEEKDSIQNGVIYDLYFCLQGGSMPTVIARWSSFGPDYISGLHADNVGALLVAKTMAKVRGLI